MTWQNGSETSREGTPTAGRPALRGDYGEREVTHSDDPHPLSMSVAPRTKYRAALLELARLHEVDAALPMPYLAAQVSLSDLVDAGVPRASLYRMWETQYDFWVDLLRYLLLEHDFTQREQELPWRATQRDRPTSRGRPSPGELDVIVARRLNLLQRVVLADIRVLIRAASLGYPDLADVQIIRRQVEAERLRSLATETCRAAAAADLTLPSVDAAIDVAALHWSIGDGLSVLHHFHPSCAAPVTVDFGHGSIEWSLLALATRAFRSGFSVPVAPGDEPIKIETAQAPTGVEPDWTERQIHTLDIATQLFLRTVRDDAARWGSVRPSTAVLAHLTVARLASYAKVTRRTIYNAWPTRSEMLADLLDDLLADRRREWLGALSQARSASGSLTLAPVTDALVRLGSPDAVDPALAFLIEPHNPAYRRSWKEQFDVLMAALRQHLGIHLRATGRRPRPGITVEHLGILWLCLINGGQRLRRTGGHTTDHFGQAADVIVEELTEPT